MISYDTINSSPSTTGIYFLVNNHEIIYIGKAVNIKARLRSHWQNRLLDNKEKSILEESNKITFTTTISEFDAILLEAKLIKLHKPKYNVVWKDDKSFLYIKITVNDVYPKIYIVREENDLSARYFGPFQSSRVARKILITIRQCIPYCSSKTISSRSCFYAQINLCDPCPNFIHKQNILGSKDTTRLTKKYQSNLKLITKILEGNSNFVINHLERKLKKAITGQDYEKAIDMRNSLSILKKLQFSAFDSFNLINEGIVINYRTLIFDFLRIYFGIKKTKYNYRIECFDISNLLNKNVTGSRVVFINEISDKGQYRRYKVGEYSSDIERMASVLSRRFRNEKNYPDLIIIDGGGQQLKPIKRLLNELNLEIPLVGIVKHPDRILSSRDFKQIPVSSHDHFYRLIQQIRDESHRFAKKYHLLLRTRKILI